MIQTSNQDWHRRKSQGLTLIELLVVLTILIALGGIVVSTLPGLLGRTQSATAAANVPEIDSAIRRRLVTEQGQLGNRFDALVTGTSSANGNVAEYVGGNQFFQASSLDDADLQALAAIGITELIPAAQNPADATFESHTQPPTILGVGGKVCMIAEGVAAEMMERIWNIQPQTDSQQQNRYLVFGLGSKSTLVGGNKDSLFAEAPVHFSDEAATNPKKMYSRYLIVVELSAKPDQVPVARYIGVAVPGLSGLRGIGEELKDAYSNDG